MSSELEYVRRELDDLKTGIADLRKDFKKCIPILSNIAKVQTTIEHFTKRIDDLRDNDKEIFKRLNNVEQKVYGNIIRVGFGEWFVRLLIASMVGLTVYFLK